MIEEIYQTYLRNCLVSTDTRNITPGSVFFALKGANFNANEFASAALSSGAIAAVIDERQYDDGSGRFFVCDDVLTTLQQLATHHRRTLTQTTFIGITGSNGKTTSKELIHAVLSTTFPTAATKGNLNNHIGVPLTLLSVNNTHRFAVIEMGANHVGEIAALAKIAEPNYGVITNIGKAHLEGFGGLEGVIKAKTEMYEYIKQNGGELFVNADDPLLMGKSEAISRITYGCTHEADHQIELLHSSPYLSFAWNSNCDSIIVDTQIIGDYNLPNIALALTIGETFDVPVDQALGAVAHYVSDNNRSQLVKTEKNTIILDAYNANPKSMEAALGNFSRMEGNNKVAILGDMLEMGEYSRQEHETIVRTAEGYQFRDLILIGKEFCSVAAKHKCFPNVDAAMDFLAGNPFAGMQVLVKGSRGVRMEKLLPLL